jgi:hypothetical protein
MKAAVCWCVRISALIFSSRAAIAALVVLATAASGYAEAPAPIHPYRIQTGQRVRLWTAPEYGGFVAENAVVTAVDSEGLTVVFKNRTELVDFTHLTRMDVRRGWRHMRAAAVIGLVTGAVVGALAEDGDGGDKALSAAVYGAAGAGLGALAAGAIWPAKWLPVDVAALRPAPMASQGRGARIAFTLTF